MKKIVYILIVSFAVIFAACEPQMDTAPDLGSLPTGEISAVASGENSVVFTAPDGYLYNWDFGTGQESTKQTETVYYPFQGSYNVTLTLGSKAGTAKLTHTVTIAATDPEVSQQYIIKELTDGGAGRTWVYATDNPSGTYYYMVAPYDWSEYWWSPVHDDGEELSGIFNEISFDLDGGLNCTLYEKTSADEVVDGQVGTFSVNIASKSIQIFNTHIPDYDDGGANLNPNLTITGIYDVFLINDNELILHQSQFADDYDWCWRFKRKGYNYPTK